MEEGWQRADGHGARLNSGPPGWACSVLIGTQQSVPSFLSSCFFGIRAGVDFRVAGEGSG